MSDVQLDEAEGVLTDGIHAYVYAYVVAAVHAQTKWHMQVMDLSSNCLSAFPEDVFRCPNLEILKLSGNQLTEIPTAIEQSVKLKELHIASNQLQLMPAEVGHCSGLEHIDCSSNQLTCLPEGLGNLKKLRRLILNHNQQLRSIPSAVLRDCILLHTLEMHDTLVSREVKFLHSLVEDTICLFCSILLPLCIGVQQYRLWLIMGCNNVQLCADPTKYRWL